MAARFWHSDKADVVCDLCPRGCRLPDGACGYCRIRRNSGGKMITVINGNYSSLAVDPIEKKPLFHFLPGTKTLSFGTIGCNLGCRFCQNWEISQSGDSGLITRSLNPAQWPQLCRDKNCPSIAFTYNEPLVSFENTARIAEECRSNGIATVLVSAGYINPEPLLELAPVISAANIDLKGFDDGFYRSYCDASLRPVLDTLLTLRRMGVHLEITNLLIPECNDDLERIRMMCQWVAAELGADTPLHFSAYHPAWRLSKPATGFAALYAAWSVARECGMKYVYIGNVSNERYNSTFCSRCGETVLERCGYSVRLLTSDGKCPACAAEVCKMQL